MKNLIRWIIPVLFLLFIVSCKKNSTSDTPTPDTTKPVINLIDPTVGKTYLLGTAMHLQMDLSDNVELKSYKVTIGKSLKGLETSDWAFSQTWAIPAGKKTFSVNQNEITIPSTITGKQTTTGNYDVLISCSDLAGNEVSTSLTILLTK